MQVKRYPTKNVLACAILIFGVCSALLLIIDAATGGTFMPAECMSPGLHSILPLNLTDHGLVRNNHPDDSWPYYGT